MSPKLAPSMLTDAARLGRTQDNWTTLESQPVDPMTGGTAFVTLPESQILEQKPPLHPFSISLPITAVPIALNRHRVPRPESQGDWNAKKDVIRSLYLDGNLPLNDVMGIMSKEHSFSATERMYKRQFQKWNWKKYNTKAFQRSRTQGLLVETRRGVATCRRPARRHLNQVPIQVKSQSHRGSRESCAQTPPRPAGKCLYGNRLYEWAEKTYAGIRDIILDTARRNVSWGRLNRHQRVSPYGFAVRCSFCVAFDFFNMRDFGNFGRLLRQGFMDIEHVIAVDPEPITFYEELLIHIPYHHVLHSIHRIVADYYTAIRGECDFSSICARHRVIRSTLTITPTRSPSSCG
ncbi:hypothetical protein LX36DRAFT_729957 [Colletotrichum falcatum]|nr:hypothetical protein LX36DRAFT_729957 [Colletotrichum falcatum]